jgi:hypothetical protein
MTLCESCKKEESLENYQILIGSDSVYFCSQECLNRYAENLKTRGIVFGTKVLADYQITLNVTEGAEENE